LAKQRPRPGIYETRKGSDEGRRREQRQAEKGRRKRTEKKGRVGRKKKKRRKEKGEKKRKRRKKKKKRHAPNVCHADPSVTADPRCRTASGFPAATAARLS
jgi:hypothetical protein